MVPPQIKSRPRQFILKVLLVVSLGIAAWIGFFSQREHTLLALIVFAPFFAWVCIRLVLPIAAGCVVLTSKLIDFHLNPNGTHRRIIYSVVVTVAMLGSTYLVNNDGVDKTIMWGVAFCLLSVVLTGIWRKKPVPPK